MTPRALNKSKKSPKTTSTALGPYMKKKRLAAGMSLQKVAAYLEVSVKEIEQYEAGKKSIPLNRVYALSNCLNISPDEVTRLLNLG